MLDLPVMPVSFPFLFEPPDPEEPLPSVFEATALSPSFPPVPLPLPSDCLESAPELFVLPPEPFLPVPSLLLSLASEATAL